MRMLNKNKSLFESFQENLNEVTADPSIVGDNSRYIFNNLCQDNGDLRDVDWDDYLLDYGFNEAENERIKENLINAWNNVADHIYYDHEGGREKYIELAANHTMFKLNNDKADEELYVDLVNQAVEAFEEETGVKLYLLGRSCRHACVELDYDNAVNFHNLQEVQNRLEQSVIDDFNSYEGTNESAVENGIDPEGGVEPLEEQDNTVRITTSQQAERDYTITDVTELNKIADGDVQPPIDITGLLNEVDARLNESVGENWGVINYQSTRYNSETGNSNALFELCVQDKTYLMSMLLEENGSLLKVNNTKGQTVFKRKTSDATSLAESYIRQFIPMNEAEELDKTECRDEPLKERLEKIIAGHENLTNLYTILNFMIDSMKDVKDDGQYFNMLQNKVYAFVAELSGEVHPCTPNEGDETNFDTFDSMVEELFGKDFVKVADDSETVPTIEGTETLKESGIYDGTCRKCNKDLSDTKEKYVIDGQLYCLDCKGDAEQAKIDAEEAYKKSQEIYEDDAVAVEEPVSDETAGDAETPKQGLGTGYAAFIRKPMSLEDLENKAKYFTDGDSSYIIVSKEKLTKEEFDKLTDGLQAPNEYCKAFEPVDTDNYAFNVIEFSCDEIGYKLLVDPSGYDYCRYVAKVGGNN